MIARLALAIGLLLASLGPARAEGLVVFAAASLKGPLDRIAEAWPVDVAVSYGGSGVQARQVAMGAPADVLVLANPDWMDWAEDAGAIDPATRQDILGNALVLVAPLGHEAVALTPEALSNALGDEGRLAMGLTASVPAGQYGRAALEALGLWEGVADRLAEVDNVRAALALVSRGEAPLGVVYATDALADEGVQIVARFPAGSHPPIRYVAAATAGAGPDAAVFVAALRDHPIFRDAGFEAPGG